MFTGLTLLKTCSCVLSTIVRAIKRVMKGHPSERWTQFQKSLAFKMNCFSLTAISVITGWYYANRMFLCFLMARGHMIHRDRGDNLPAWNRKSEQLWMSSEISFGLSRGSNRCLKRIPALHNIMHCDVISVTHSLFFASLCLFLHCSGVFWWCSSRATRTWALGEESLATVTCKPALCFS